MAALVPTDLVVIDEEEEFPADFDTIVDPVRLKNLRSGGKTSHTKSGKSLMNAIRIGDDRDTVRALRVNYVRRFDNLETRHDRYVNSIAANAAPDDLDGEAQWLQAVIHDHQRTLTECDAYLDRTKSTSASSITSRSSSRRSSRSSVQARINEAEMKEKEAELLLRQAEDEARRREEEDDNLRKQEEYKNRVEADRKQRELRDEMDRQRLSGAILRRQLTETVDPDNPSGSTRATSVSGMSSSAISLTSLFQRNPAPPPILIVPSSPSILPGPITTMIGSVPEAVVTTTSAILQHDNWATSGPANTSSMTAQPVTTPPGTATRSAPPTRLFAPSKMTIPPTSKLGVFTPATAKPGVFSQMKDLATRVFTPSKTMARSSSVPVITGSGSTDPSTVTSISNSTFSIASTTNTVTTANATSIPISNPTVPISNTSVPISTQTCVPPTWNTSSTTAPIYSWRNFGQMPSGNAQPTQPAHPPISTFAPTGIPSTTQIIGGTTSGPTTVASTFPIHSGTNPTYMQTGSGPSTNHIPHGPATSSANPPHTSSAAPPPTAYASGVPGSGYPYGPAATSATSSYAPPASGILGSGYPHGSATSSAIPPHASVPHFTIPPYSTAAPTTIAAHTFISNPFPYNPTVPSFIPGVVTNPTYAPIPGPLIMPTSTPGPQYGVYTPDAWIHNIGTPYASTSRSGVKPPRMKVPSFNGDPSAWPMFIQMFKIFIHDAVSSDAERIAHLHDALTPEIRKNIGGALLNPGLYQHALSELHKRYGNPQIVSQACTSSLLKLRPFKDNDFNALRSFSADLHSVVATLRLGGYGMELHSHATLSQLVAKLPPALKSRWGEKSWAMQPTLATVEDLDQWLDGVAMAEQSIRAGSSEAPHQKQGKQVDDKRRSAHKVNAFSTSIATQQAGDTRRCPGCNSTHHHHMKECKKFKSIPVEKRAEIVKEARLCIRCLGSDHLFRSCTQTERCDQLNCDGVHHSLLHGAPRLYPKRKEAKPTTAEFSGSVTTTISSGHTLLRIVPIILKAGGKELPLYAVLDPGSQISVLTRRTARSFNLRGPVKRVIINTVDGESKPTDREIVNFEITSKDGRSSFEIVDAHVTDRFNFQQRPIDLDALVKRWPHLAHVPIDSTKQEDVILLVGQDHPAAVEVFETKMDPYDQRAPRAYLTAFGWCLGGPSGQDNSRSKDCFHSSTLTDRCDLMLQQFIEADTFGTKPNVIKPISKEEKRAWEILNTTTRHDGVRYESGLLWKVDDPNLPNNFFAAQRRFLNLEAKLIKDKGLAAIYKSVIDTYVSLKHARKLTKAEIDAGPNGRTWYCPHHPVFNPNKPGKCRVVFDLSAEYKGVCLNDVLMRGPDLLTNLIGILLRFRQHRVAVVADVEKMFHQVRVRPSDGPAFRFIWRDPGSTQPPDIYQMDVHLFGAVSSPAVCSNALQRAVKDSNDSEILLPQITRHFYMDNWLVSFPVADEAISTAKRLTEALKIGGFPLTQWATSDDQVKSALIGQQQKETSLNMDLDEEPIERTLGLVWDFHRDAFVLGAKAEADGKTKRDIMKAIYSIFDPLGFLAPIVFQAKVLMQDIWRHKYDWDEELPPDLTDRWARWAGSLPSLSGLILERCISPQRNDVTSIELHVFGDASEMGYGAVAYARFVLQDDTTEVRFLISKARVAPLKFMTIPRLELNAAVLATRLGSQIIKEHDIIFGKAFYWTDSTTVLSWIQSRSCRFNSYVGNRVGEIFETTSPEHWNYVPSASNPADDASRGLDPSEFKVDHRWFAGPSFLRGSDNWPKLPSLPQIEDSDPEIREASWIGLTERGSDEIDLLIQRKSRLDIIIRSIGYIFRFIRNAREKNRNRRKTGGLSAKEFQAARCFLLRRVQSNAYQREIEDIQTGRPIDKGSQLIKLSPYLDHRGLLCVGGRIDKAPLPIDTRHPIILPRTERVTELILFSLHRQRAHLSAEQLHHEARKEFWIPKGRITSRRVYNSCYRCRKASAKGITPMMAALPAIRLKVGYPPFTHTGVDYFGPILVTIFRRTIKRWGCIYTCLSTRCVHLEMAYSLDTSSFISALDRFQNRRGVPASYHSDNGTNFVGAQRELAACLENLNQHAIKEHLSRQPTKWYFNPPAAPHFGGVWERMVRAAKTALNAVLGNQRLTDEILLTALTLVENILNSRNLTPMSEDPTDPECLTPNHLLLGRACPNLPPDVFTEKDLSAKQKWRVAQALAEQFWRRWMKEVIPNLNEREKWQQQQPNLEVGDIVVIIDSSSPRGVWPTGRVTKVFPGPDGVVRSVSLLTNGTERHRPVHTLFLLESVRLREGALSTAKRRAGDVAESTTGKTVSFEPGLATQQGE